MVKLVKFKFDSSELTLATDIINTLIANLQVECLGTTLVSLAMYHHAIKSISIEDGAPSDYQLALQLITLITSLPDQLLSDMLNHSEYYYGPNSYATAAELTAKCSNCLRIRYGCVIVSANDGIISKGYNRINGVMSCKESGKCLRSDLNIDHGTRYEVCRSVHAEQMALVHADPNKLEGSVLYLVAVNPDNDGLYTKSSTECCLICKRLLIESGVSRVVYCTKSEDPDKSYKFKVESVSSWKDSEYV